MEGEKNFGIESRESIIDQSIEDLATREGMDPDFVFADIIQFAPFEGNESVNLEYLAEMAEKLGITIEEMHLYAINKTLNEE